MVENFVTYTYEWTGKINLRMFAEHFWLIPRDKGLKNRPPLHKTRCKLRKVQRLLEATFVFWLVLQEWDGDIIFLQYSDIYSTRKHHKKFFDALNSTQNSTSKNLPPSQKIFKIAKFCTQNFYNTEMSRERSSSYYIHNSKYTHIIMWTIINDETRSFCWHLLVSLSFSILYSDRLKITLQLLVYKVCNVFNMWRAEIFKRFLPSYGQIKALKFNGS